MTEIRESWGQVQQDLLRGDCYRVVNHRTGLTVGYLDLQPPSDLAAIVANEDTSPVVRRYRSGGASHEFTPEQRRKGGSASRRAGGGHPPFTDEDRAKAAAARREQAAGQRTPSAAELAELVTGRAGR